uniref:Agouti domain-containing protein n=1 Tax=Nothobranchius furzeri TaxID=105023 RepID=A0A8C6PXI2_NOTFU
FMDSPILTHNKDGCCWFSVKLMSRLVEANQLFQVVFGEIKCFKVNTFSGRVTFLLSYQTVSPSPKSFPPTHVALSSVMSECSLLGQSCTLLCGCCDPCATCHCRFFNTICFCRKSSFHCEKKTSNSRKAKQSERAALK